MCYCLRAWGAVIPPPPCPTHSRAAIDGHTTLAELLADGWVIAGALRED